MIKDHKSPEYHALLRPAEVQVKVGILERDAGRDHGKGTTIAEIAEIHEFGLGVPERSFIRAWYDGNKERAQDVLLSRIKKAVLGKITFQQAGDQVALWAAADMQKRIVAGIEPGLAPATIARKGSSTPLIDHGVLKGAISGEATLV